MLESPLYFPLHCRSVEDLTEVFLLPGQEDLAARCLALQERLASLEKAGSPSSKLEEFLSRQGAGEEVRSLRAAAEDLGSRLTLIKQRSVEQEKELGDRELIILQLRQEKEKEREGAVQEGRRQVAALRLEVQEQRERCLGLLEEKDLEIQKLRIQVEAAVEEAFYGGGGRPGSCSRESSKSPLALPRRVSVDSSLELGKQDSSSSGPPLHYVQELSRKEVEIKELRSQQYQAETGLREVQLQMSNKEEKYQVVSPILGLNLRKVPLAK